MNVSPAGSGTIILSNLSTDEETVPSTYPESFTCFFISNTVSAQATAMPGYIFDHWTIDPIPEIFNSAATPVSFVNNEPRQLTAYFKEIPLPTFEPEAITVLSAKNMLDSRADILAIDVSQTTDFDSAHLICAINYPWVSGKLSDEYTTFSDYRDNDIIIYDQNGSVSKTAADFLSENGFSAVYYMIGGLNNWRDSGYQVVDSDCKCETCSLPPIAYAGSDQTVTEGNPVVLYAEGSSNNSGTIETFYWEQIAGDQTVILSDNTSANPTFSAPYVQQGGDKLIFHLTVTDTQNNQDTDSVAIFVNWFNDPPVADAGPDQDIKMNQTVILDGSGSSDPDGTIATYFWTIDAGSLEIEISNNNTVNPEFTAQNTSGWVRFLLTVTDSDGKTDTDSVTITINASTNAPPEANAGDDQTIDEGETVQLDASESADPDGSLTKYFWAQTSGPEVKLSDETAVLPTFNIPEIDETTELVFLLTVEDNNGVTDTDDIMVTVNNITDCSWNAVELDWNCPDETDETDEEEIDNEEISDNDTIEPEESEPEKSDNGSGGSSCFISSSLFD